MTLTDLSPDVPVAVRKTYDELMGNPHRAVD